MPSGALRSEVRVGLLVVWLQMLLLRMWFGVWLPRVRGLLLVLGYCRVGCVVSWPGWFLSLLL